MTCIMVLHSGVFMNLYRIARQVILAAGCNYFSDQYDYGGQVLSMVPILASYL